MVSELKTFTNKGCKSRRKKYCFWANFALLSRIFLVLVFLTPFNVLFAPTSGNPTSKLFIFIFRILGKKSLKEVVSDFKPFAHEGSKLAAQFFFFFFFDEICPTSRIFLVLVLLSATIDRCFVARTRNFYIAFVTKAFCVKKTYKEL